MSQVAEIKGLDELIKRMEAYPGQLIKVIAVGMSASLNIFWENVPPYPAKPHRSKYNRTGTLGKSFGSDQSGGASGEPSVYRIRQVGGGNMEGVFGSNLEYAPYVMGDDQSPLFAEIGWSTIGKIAEKASPKVNDLWDGIAQNMADFLDRQGV